MRKKIFQLLSIFCVISIPFFFHTPIFAASDFEVSSHTVIDYKKGREFVELTETVTFQVNNDKYFLQPGAIHYFYLGDYLNEDSKKERAYKLSTISIKDIYEIPMKYTVKADKNGITLEVKINQKILPYDDYSLTLKYRTHDLINVNGNVTNIYVPGLSKDTRFTSSTKYGLETKYNYSATISTPLDYTLPSYTQPGTIKRSEDKNKRYYTVVGKDLVGHMAWLQFGTNQYYKFKLTQEAVKTDNLIPKGISDLVPIVSTNIYKIALPREYEETNQSVTIQEISPKPKSYERDFDGNLIALFEVPANATSQILISGFISLSKKDILTQKKIADINLASYHEEIKTLPDLTTYVQSDRYWEKDDPLIQGIAKDLLSESSTIMELIENDYQYVIKKFEYSDEKLLQGNIRLGAKAALSGSETICMEYSDALTAILRAQGIPSRIAIGYGNDPKSQENKISNTQLVKQTIGHQWTQVWIPNYGWLSIDPTWGESERKYIGSDLDHILWYTVSSSTQGITDSIFYSAEMSKIGNYEIYLQALTKNQYDQEVDGSIPIDQLNILEQKDQLPLDFYIKTSILGKAFVFLIPIIATVFISTIITTVIYTIKGNLKKRKSV